MSFMDKAKDLAGQHPDQARQGIDAAEDAVNQRTGGQHADAVGRAGDVAEKGLGVNEHPAAQDAPTDREPAADQMPPGQPPA